MKNVTAEVKPGNLNQLKEFKCRPENKELPEENGLQHSPLALSQSQSFLRFKLSWNQ